MIAQGVMDDAESALNLWLGPSRGSYRRVREIIKGHQSADAAFIAAYVASKLKPADNFVEWLEHGIPEEW